MASSASDVRNATARSSRAWIERRQVGRLADREHPDRDLRAVAEERGAQQARARAEHLDHVAARRVHAGHVRAVDPRVAAADALFAARGDSDGRHGNGGPLPGAVSILSYDARMLTRRAFLHTAVAGGVAVAAGHRSSAAEFDLVVKGGRVIDPAQRFDALADVGIGGGRITAVRPSIPASAAAEVLDASGALVTPGLVDVHTHVRSAEMPSICLSQGVTSLVDAGSRGADQIDSVVAFAKQAPNRVRVLINLSRAGVIDEGDLMDLSRADVALARDGHPAPPRRRSIGVKARLSRNVAGERDLDALRRAQEITRPLGLPVMIHIGQTFSTMPAAAGAAQARRHRHPHVRVPAQLHLRRQGRRAARSDRRASTRHPLRHRQRTHRPLHVGHDG